MENIKKATKNLKKELGKEVKIEAVVSALTRRGFTLFYTNTDEGIEQLERYNLTQYAKNKKCFTYISSVKLVFVDDTLHRNDIKKLLLHELAHIDLRHVGYTDCQIYDEVSAEVEADAVVYNVLNHNNSKHISAALIIFAILLLNIMGICIVHQRQDAPKDVPAATQQHPENTNDTLDVVYISPGGSRFHREFCKYAKADGALTIPREEAAKHYTPCKLCNP